MPVYCPTRSCENAIFDIDGTLLYSSEDLLDPMGITPKEITFRSFDDYENIVMYVYLRPGVQSLISSVTSHYGTGIWSVGQPNYVVEVCKLLDIGVDHPVNPVTFVYNWEQCIRRGAKITKPIAECPFKGTRTVIIEDTIESCDEADPYIIVPRFECITATDTALYDLAKVLVRE